MFRIYLYKETGEIYFDTISDKHPLDAENEKIIWEEIDAHPSQKAIRVDVVTKKLVLEDLPVIVTNEQSQITNLKNQIVLLEQETIELQYQLLTGEVL